MRKHNSERKANEMWDSLKNKYLEAKRINGGYTFEQLQILRDMAKHEVYPDGQFSDEECNVWSMFHMMKAV